MKLHLSILDPKSIFIKYCLLFLFTTTVFAQKQMENLDRGTVAVRTNNDEVLVSWRILGTEFDNTTYNVYRDNKLLNKEPITGASNLIDKTKENYHYSIAAIVNGKELEKSQPIEVWNKIYKKIPITAPEGGVSPDGRAYKYTANDISVADLDGDGAYDLVLKWTPTNDHDNSHRGYTGKTYLQGLKMDGTVFWTIDLGINIRSGAHYTQFMVYDLDGDGKAEVACKTADGTVDGTGRVLGDASADYRNSTGYILEGPEYLSLFNGETGAFITTQDYIPQRGNVASWGDSYGNRVDRFLACVAYLDGQRPSLVFCRGYYTRTVIAAYDYRDGQLTNRWVFDSNDRGNQYYAGQGAHSVTVGDVDGDGKDEIHYGSCAIDDNGKGLYTTHFGHGDAIHLGDFDPAREGLEYFMVHEEANDPNVPQVDYRDPKTGEAFWLTPGKGDIGRGVIADIDPNYLGAEMWSSNGKGIFNIKGEVISKVYPRTYRGPSWNMFGWWDGDLLREMVDKTVIVKWNPEKQDTDVLLRAYDYDGMKLRSNNGTKSNPCIIADVLGDWREEVIWRTEDNTSLVLFTTPYSTKEKIFTLMHDPLYRTSIAWQNVAYNQPAHTGFYLGVGMKTPKSPKIYLAKSPE